MKDLSRHQEKIVKRYYEHRETIRSEKLTELVTQLYLADPRKQAALWKRVEQGLQARGVAESRIEHVVGSRDVTLLAKLAAELDRA